MTKSYYRPLCTCMYDMYECLQKITRDMQKKTDVYYLTLKILLLPFIKPRKHVRNI